MMPGLGWTLKSPIPSGTCHWQNQFDSVATADTIQDAAGNGEPTKRGIHGQTDISQDRGDDPRGGKPCPTADSDRRRNERRNEVAYFRGNVAPRGHPALGRHARMGALAAHTGYRLPEEPGAELDGQCERHARVPGRKVWRWHLLRRVAGR